MPIYEYVCEGCRSRFEKIVARREEAGTCPHCGGRKLQLQLSVFATRRADGGSGPGSSGGNGGGCGCTPSTCGCR